MIRQIPGTEEVTMTTNGVLLGENLEDLLAAGLDAVNISLDTLDRGTLSGNYRTGRTFQGAGKCGSGSRCRNPGENQQCTSKRHE